MSFDINRFRLEGLVTVVTGAGAGIGRAVAELFAGAGSSVVAGDLDRDAAAATAEAATAGGGRVIPVGCDVTREEDLTAVVDAATGEFGGIDILVNNAGGGRLRVGVPPQRVRVVPPDPAVRTAHAGPGRWSGAQHQLHGRSEHQLADGVILPGY